MGLVVSALGAAYSLICALVSATCCACTMFRCCCTGGMGSGGVGKKMAKFLYVVLLGCGTLVAYIIGRYGENVLVDESANVAGIEFFRFTVNCNELGTVCSGDGAIFRASCACVFFFAFMLIGMIPRPTFSGNKNWVPLFGEGFHRGWWGFKSLIFFGLLFGSFFFPPSFFNDDVYTEVARFVSVIFLAIQVLVLIDFAYTWNDTWVARAYGDDSDEPSKGWLYALLFCAAVLYVIALGGLITLFIFYQNCSSTLAFCIITLIGFVIYFGLSLGSVYIVNAVRMCFCQDTMDPEDGEAASIAPASVVAAYCTYLLWSASRSNPDTSTQCNPFNEVLGRDGWEIFIGISFASLSLMWTAYAASSSAGNLLKGDRSADAAETGNATSGAYQIGENEDGTAKYAKDERKDDDPDDDEPEPYLWLFHLLMLTASFYMAMVLTNWGVSELDIEEAASGDVGLVSMWVKIAAQWASMLLFIWTLVAPYVFEDRDFS